MPQKRQGQEQALGPPRPPRAGQGTRGSAPCSQEPRAPDPGKQHSHAQHSRRPAGVTKGSETRRQAAAVPGPGSAGDGARLGAQVVTRRWGFLPWLCLTT